MKFIFKGTEIGHAFIVEIGGKKSLPFLDIRTVSEIAGYKHGIPASHLDGHCYILGNGVRHFSLLALKEAQTAATGKRSENLYKLLAAAKKCFGVEENVIRRSPPVPVKPDTTRVDKSSWTNYCKAKAALDLAKVIEIEAWNKLKEERDNG